MKAGPLTALPRYISNRWRQPGGYRELLVIAAPLIITSGAFSIQHFIDRMFLFWHSEVSVGAAMSSGLLFFTVISLFMGIVRYANVFIAQYFGAGREDRVGAVLWQSIYVALIGGVLVMGLWFVSEPLFRLIGHEEAVQQEELIYFRILCLGAIPNLVSASLDSFYTGLGRTAPVMWVTISGTIVNIILDYLLIFGNFGFPSMGIAGAALATVLASVWVCVCFAVMLAQPKYDARFRVRRAWRFDPRLSWRLLKFGLPSGIQFFTDIIGFSVFILLIGRLGSIELAASTLAFNVNLLAFMPMMGMGIAVSVVVGRCLGSNDPDQAEYGVYSGFQLATVYMVLISASYVLLPNLYIAPFAAKADPTTLAEVRRLTIILLQFVAIYSVFDSLNIIFISAVKGAGDTHFAMKLMLGMSMLGLVLPSYIAVVVYDAGIYGLWMILTVYIIVLGGLFLWRFRQGAWRNMRVTDDDERSADGAVLP